MFIRKVPNVNRTRNLSLPQKVIFKHFPKISHFKNEITTESVYRELYILQENGVVELNIS